jgi:signal transduction histidine kinase
LYHYFNVPLLLILLLLVALVLVAVTITLVARQRINSVKFVYAREALQTEKELLRTRLEIQDHTLAVVYEQIHDNIGQMLTAIHMKLHTMGAISDQKDETITALASGLRSSIKDLANLGHAVDSAVIARTGLVDALEHETNFFSSINNLTCIFTCPDDLPELSAVEEVYLFRLIQEMMSFMALLTKEKAMAVHLEKKDTNIIIKISVPDTAVHTDGNKISKTFQHIETRVEHLGGTLLHTNNEGTGQLLTFTYKARP